MVLLFLISCALHIRAQFWQPLSICIDLYWHVNTYDCNLATQVQFLYTFSLTDLFTRWLWYLCQQESLALETPHTTSITVWSAWEVGISLLCTKIQSQRSDALVGEQWNRAFLKNLTSWPYTISLKRAVSQDGETLSYSTTARKTRGLGQEDWRLQLLKLMASTAQQR